MSGPHSSLSARRPPSTTRPPSSNVQVPIAERLPRPTARASARASRLDAVELGERPRNRERELRPRAKPDMGRQRAVDVHGSAAAEIVVGEEQAREFAGAFGVFAVRRERVGARRRHEECRSCRGRANAAEPAPARASQIEHAEVQSRRSLDEDRLFVPCGHRRGYLVPALRGRGEVVANDLAALHDELHPLQLGDVGERVA